MRGQIRRELRALRRQLHEERLDGRVLHMIRGIAERQLLVLAHSDQVVQYPSFIVIGHDILLVPNVRLVPTVCLAPNVRAFAVVARASLASSHITTCCTNLVTTGLGIGERRRGTTRSEKSQSDLLHPGK